jgi:hypothetical protein
MLDTGLEIYTVSSGQIIGYIANPDAQLAIQDVDKLFTQVSAVFICRQGLVRG